LVTLRGIHAARIDVHWDVLPRTTRDIEFIADNPGDGALHCHKVHHRVNQMGHLRNDDEDPGWYDHPLGTVASLRP
jgi:hypothetical protein